MSRPSNKSDHSRWVREAAAAKHLGVSQPFLAKDRCKQRLGIPFFRLGRTVIYDLDALTEWMEKKANGEN